MMEVNGKQCMINFVAFMTCGGGSLRSDQVLGGRGQELDMKWQGYWYIDRYSIGCFSS